MATARFIPGIICLIALIGYRVPDGNLLSAESREKILQIARSQLHVRETGKNNYGKEIKEYLAYTRFSEGNPYCAAFVSYVFKKAGYLEPRTAWSPSLFPTARSTLSPKPADVLGIYSVALKRIAHAGLVERREGSWIISVEGNTGADGGREGDGVYRKRRHIKTIAKFADWVRPLRGGEDDD